jgi:hypothetical protein
MVAVSLSEHSGERGLQMRDLDADDSQTGASTADRLPCGNVEIVEAAVSDREGTAFFSGEGAIGKLSQTGTPTKIVQLDNFPRPDFIKMDIEGEETAALRGSANILAERHAVWFIAVHGPAYIEKPAFLARQNYTVKWVTQDEIYARATPQD